MPRLLPIDSAKLCQKVEMPVSAQNRKFVLAAGCSDPDFVGRNRSSSFLEFRAKCGVTDGRFLIHVKDAVVRKRIHQPLLVPLAFPGLPNAISILAQCDYGNGDFSRLFLCRTGWRFEFVLDRFRHKLAKWIPRSIDGLSRINV